MGRGLHEADRRLVEHEPPDAFGEQRRLERADAAVRVPQHADRAAGPLDDRGDVLVLAFERVDGRIAAAAAAAAVDSQDGEALARGLP